MAEINKIQQNNGVNDINLQPQTQTEQKSAENITFCLNKRKENKTKK